MFKRHARQQQQFLGNVIPRLVHENFVLARKLEIDRGDYVLLEGKTEAIVFLRPGALGYQWIERVAPTPQPE